MKQRLLWLGLGMVIGAVIASVGLMLIKDQTDYIYPFWQSYSVDEPPLLAYSFPRLMEYVPSASPIELQGVISTESSFTAYQFVFTTDSKKMSGQLNKPKSEGRMPVVIMIRGFVPLSIYQTGVGTRNAASYFANNGFVTVAPDFLGYGQSDPEEVDSFAARVKRPAQVLDLIASVKQLEYVNPDQIFIWGHSNGGQIALSLLEITGEDYPTTLWAPVTKPFPYSILYYTDTYTDGGRELRRVLSNFEQIYDVHDYSITNFLDRIQAPLQLHQGGRDPDVPSAWSDEFVTKLKEINQNQLTINYFVYPTADHNLRPDWNTVVARDLEFFRRYM